MDVSKHYFDLDGAKRKLLSKFIQRKRPTKPALTTLMLPTRIRKKESEVSILFSESPFMKNFIKTPKKVRNIIYPPYVI